MARIISIINQKGGVGKTTTAVNLSIHLALKGKFVLLVDLDPQGNATSGLGVNPNTIEQGVYELLVGTHQMHDVTLASGYDGHSIIPASADLAGANIELVHVENREFRLREAVTEVRNHYDYVIIDSPPSLGLLTVNSLVAADELLIPVQCEYYALEGLSNLIETIRMVKENLRPDLKVLGALLTMYDERYRLTQAVFNEMYQYFPEKIFKTVIPRNIALAEAPSHGLPVVKYKKRSKGAKAYDRLAKEVIDTE